MIEILLSEIAFNIVFIMELVLLCNNSQLKTQKAIIKKNKNAIIV